MVITQKIQIDLAIREAVEVLQAVQGDENSRVVEITLLDNGQAWVAPGGAAGVVRFRRPDGNGGNYDTGPDGKAAVTIAGNVVTARIAPEVLAVPGVAMVTVGITSGSAVLHTFVFGIDVQKNPGLNVTAGGGFYLAGTLMDSGWDPNKYLGTNAEGKVVVLDAPEGTGGAGATAEQLAQIQANKEAIEDIQDPVVSGHCDVNGNTWTMNVTRESGVVDVVVLEFDGNGLISSVTENGRVVPWTFTGV